MTSSTATVATATAVMMASSSSSTGGLLSGTSAAKEVTFKVVKVTTEAINRNLDDIEHLKVVVMGGSPHCTFSTVEFINIVSYDI